MKISEALRKVEAWSNIDKSTIRETVKNLLRSVETTHLNELIENGNVVSVGKVFRPTELKKYDVVMAMMYNCPHPAVVYKIVDNTVFVAGITSNEREGITSEKIEKSRFFQGSYMTNTFTMLTKADAEKGFVGVFDDRKLADKVFAKTILLYKQFIK